MAQTGTYYIIIQFVFRFLSLLNCFSQPIPPCNLDLTLVSTSKFIGSCYLATSEDYIVVVTKAEAEPQTPTGTSWLL